MSSIEKENESKLNGKSPDLLNKIVENTDEINKDLVVIIKGTKSLGDEFIKLEKSLTRYIRLYK